MRVGGLTVILAGMPNNPPTVTQADTIRALLQRSKRREVPIRKTFLQQGRGRVRDAGPVAALTSNHDERGLDLYLLVHAAASADPYDVALPASAWARAIGVSGTASGRTAISKAVRRLADLRLVERERAGRHARITLLDEDGHGDPYAHPASRREPYLKLPHAYWELDWHLRLRLPGKVMLLVALSLNDGFILPIEKGPDWYGISPDTVQRGLDELQRSKLLNIDVDFKTAPLSPLGYTQQRQFTLLPPFGSLRQPLASVTKLHA